MTTEKQIQASLANGAKSTGPKTPGGKSRSRMNAVKLGIHAQGHLLPGEDPAAYAELRAGIVDALKPVGLFELLIVEEIISDVWRLRRLDITEYAAIKRAQLAIVISDGTLEALSASAIHTDVDQALKALLFREGRRFRAGNSATDIEVEPDAELVALLEKINALPLGYTLLESHARPKSNKLSAEIDRQRRVLKGDLLRQHRELLAMQKQRLALGGSEDEVEY